MCSPSGRRSALSPRTTIFRSGHRMTTFPAAKVTCAPPGTVSVEKRSAWKLQGVGRFGAGVVGCCAESVAPANSVRKDVREMQIPRCARDDGEGARDDGEGARDDGEGARD